MKFKRTAKTRSVNAFYALRQQMAECYKAETAKSDGKGYRAIAEKFGVSKPMARLIIVKGYEPKRNDIRRALGLPTTRLVRANPPTRWRDLSVAELRRAVEGRREYRP